MNENKRNMLLSFIISILFIFASLLPFSSNECVYVCYLQNWCCSWCNKYCNDERLLLFSNQKNGTFIKLVK